MRKILLCLAGGLSSASVLALCPSGALAAEFEGDGTFTFDPDALITLDFETDEPAEDGTPSRHVEDAGALSGGRVLRVPQYEGVGYPIALPQRASRYRVSAWVRGAETVADIEIRYSDNVHEGPDEAAVLYPTGRMTSDGWVELANDHVQITADRGASASIGFFSMTGSYIDAVEMVELGPLRPDERSGAYCEGSADPVCGEQGSCLFSQCRYMGGIVPDIPEDRAHVAAYLTARAQLLFGPLLNRELDLPNAELAMDRMRTADDPWEYWNAFMLGIRRLHDGHTTTSGITDFVFQNEKPLGLCFIEGDADLSHVAAPKDPFYLDVLVSHAAATRTLGLKAGDRLVAVDGEHPIAWARAQTEHHWGMSPTSNHRTFAELAEQLRGLVARYGHTITVIRCDAGTSSCGAPEDLVLADIEPVGADEAFASVQCDNRPLRHLPDSPADHANIGSENVYYGLSTSSNAEERIYGAEWESLYSTTGSDYAAAGLKAAVAQFTTDARGVILDHRSGNGGTVLGPKPLWDFAVPRRPISVYLDRQRAEDEQPDTISGLAMFQSGIDSGLADFAGSAAPTTMPVALLLTRDVSASDWLPLGFKGAASNVKIFAPFETNGGFSTRYAFGYWLGMNYVIAVGDTFDEAGVSRNGRGVPPDVVVLPRQSDLLIGKDSVYEAALAWIRQEIAQ